MVVLTKRPWGGYRILIKTPTYWIKKLVIREATRTSLQSHALRQEFWIVLSGTVIVQIGRKQYIGKKGDTFFIPKQKKHRLTGKTDATLLEFASGIVKERDIIRHADDYARSKSPNELQTDKSWQLQTVT